MLFKRLTSFITKIYFNPWARSIFLALYYLAILVGLVMLYGKGDFSTPPYVYQGF